MGQLDSPLTTRGISQACAIAERLKKEKIDRIYSSDLQRTVITAEKIAEQFNLKVHFKHDLRERSMGIFQGLTKNEILEKYPNEFQSLQKLEVNYVIPESESVFQFRDRCVRAITSIAEENLSDTVLVVTHGGVLKRFFEAVFNIQETNTTVFERVNTSYNSFHYSDKKWHLETWGDVSHLDKVGFRKNTRDVTENPKTSFINGCSNVN